MNIIVFDTETTSIDHPFCYDIGYIVYDTEAHISLTEQHFIIEQTWHNLPLFESAYYKEKRPQYIFLMRSRKASLVKWGHAMQAMARDIKRYNVSSAYAYNSDFDDKVFAFNNEWYHTINPLDNIPVYDIWGYASKIVLETEEYQTFAENNMRFTESGNYKGSAEVAYQFITRNPAFAEAHMGLYDSQIELQILVYCVENGAEWETSYKVKKILPRPQEKEYTIKVNGKIIYRGKYVKKYVRNDTYSFTERGN